MSKKIEELRAVLDMPENEQIDYLFLYGRNLDESLADLAFRLRDEVVVNQGDVAWHKAVVIVCEYMGQGTAWFKNYGQPIYWIIAALIAKEKK